MLASACVGVCTGVAQGRGTWHIVPMLTGSRGTVPADIDAVAPIAPDGLSDAYGELMDTATWMQLEGYV